MAKTYTVTLPVSPYIHDFITHLYGNPLSIDNKTFIGVFLIGVLEKSFINDNLPEKDSDYRLSFFTEKILCRAPMSMKYDYGNLINRDKIIVINRLFEKMFEERLYFYVQNNIKKNARYPGYKEAIELFAKQYNINLYNTVSMDCLLKMEYRYRKEIIKKELCGLSCPDTKKQTQFSFAS